MSDMRPSEYGHNMSVLRNDGRDYSKNKGNIPVVSVLRTPQGDERRV